MLYKRTYESTDFDMTLTFSHNLTLFSEKHLEVTVILVTAKGTQWESAHRSHQYLKQI